MIAIAGYIKYSQNPNKKYKNIKAEGNLKLNKTDHRSGNVAILYMSRIFVITQRYVSQE